MSYKNWYLPMPWWLRLFPAFSKSAATINKKIYLPDAQYQEVTSGNVGTSTQGTLIHERVHQQNQAELGFTVYALKYLFSPVFRLEEELAAHKAQFSFLKKHNYEFNLQERANEFSSMTYLWCCNAETARVKLKYIWDHA